MMLDAMISKRYELKSPDDGSVLTFEIRDRLKEEISFDVSVKTPWFTGTTRSSTYTVPSPAELFHEMAAEWMGWNEEKSWSDLEGNVEIAATSDRTGHISLQVILNGQNGESQLRTCLKFEAGQLEKFAKEIALLFE